jgi:hypothetical protein
MSNTATSSSRVDKPLIARSRSTKAPVAKRKLRSGAAYEKAYEKRFPESRWKKMFLTSALFASVVGFVVAEDEESVGLLDPDTLSRIVQQVVLQLSEIQAEQQVQSPAPTPEATEKIILETFAPRFKHRPPSFWNRNTASTALNRTVWYVQNMLVEKLPLTLVFLFIMSTAGGFAVLLPILFRRFLPMANIPEPLVRIVVHVTILFFVFGGLALGIDAVGGSVEDLWIAYGFATILILPNLSGVFSNAISAFSLTFETKVRVGSEIECEGHQGVVLEFNLRNVVLLNTGAPAQTINAPGDEQPRDRLILLPNEYLTKYPVGVIGFASNIAKLKVMLPPQMDYSLNIKQL